MSHVIFLSGVLDFEQYLIRFRLKVQLFHQTLFQLKTDIVFFLMFSTFTML